MKVDELPAREYRVGVRESARLLGVHIGAVYRWIRRGKLEAWLVGGRYVLDRRKVLAFPQRIVIDPKTKASPSPCGISHAQAVAMLRSEGYAI